MGKRTQGRFKMGWLLGCLAVSLLLAACDPSSDPDYQDAELTLESAKITATYAAVYLRDSEATYAAFATQSQIEYEDWREKEQPRITSEGIVPWALVCSALGFAAFIFVIVIPRAAWSVYRTRKNAQIDNEFEKIEQLRIQSQQLTDELHRMGVSPDDPDDAP